MSIDRRRIRQLINEQLEIMLSEGEITGKREGAQPHGYEPGRTSRPETTAEEEFEGSDKVDAAQHVAMHLDAEDESQEEQGDDPDMSFMPESWRRIAFGD